ncbi:MAG: hypothetical protein LBT55_07145 [Clostridiaceae bacterium]|jgi:hypothetical protein|nr:hypothetical protein [Clostridiaceae bacterium]
MTSGVNTIFLNKMLSSDTPFGISSNPKTSAKNPMIVTTRKQKMTDIQLYHIENQKRKIEYIDSAFVKKNSADIGKYKVFIIQSAENGDCRDKILGAIETAGEDSICSQSYL